MRRATKVSKGTGWSVSLGRNTIMVAVQKDMELAHERRVKDSCTGVEKEMRKRQPSAQLDKKNVK